MCKAPVPRNVRCVTRVSLLTTCSSKSSRSPHNGVLQTLTLLNGRSFNEDRYSIVVRVLSLGVMLRSALKRLQTPLHENRDVTILPKFFLFVE